MRRTQQSSRWDAAVSGRRRCGVSDGRSTGGVLAIADEVCPEQPVWRLLHAALRLPQALAGWLLAGSLSRPVPALRDEAETAGG